MFSILALLTLTGITSAPLATTSLPATNGRSCTAFLFAASEGRNLPVILAMAGTGEYHMGGGPEGNPLAAPLVASGRAALLTFNKPGVKTDPGSAKGFTIDDAVYNNYTVDDLTNCAAGALAWAARDVHVGPSSAIVIHGHSEGAIVGGHTLLQLSLSKSPLAGRVAALLLSGTPGGSMKEIVKAQADKNGTWALHEAALAKNDDVYFRKTGGVGAGTMRAMLGLPSLTTTFAALAKARVETRIALFHGRTDSAVPVAMAEALESENRARAIAAEPVLDLSFREYTGGHSLNVGAFHDMALWVTDAIRPDGYLSKADRPAKPRPTVALDEKSLSALVGQYRIDESMTLDVTREGGQLFGQASGQGRFPIYAASKDLLFATVAPIELRIERQGSTVPAVVLIQGGETRCLRVP